MQIPETIANELGDEVVKLMNIGRVLSETDLRILTLVKKAEKLRKADPAEGWMVLSAADMLTGNFDGMRVKGENALNLSSRDRLKINYGVTLLNAGFFSEAFRYFKLALDPAVGRLSKGVDYAAQTGHIQVAAETLKKHQQILERVFDSERAQEILNSAAFFASEGLGDEQTSEMLDLAGEVLREHKLRYLEDILFEIRRRGSAYRWAATFCVVIPESECASLEFELAQRISRALPNSRADLFYVRFSSNKSAQQKAA